MKQRDRIIILLAGDPVTDISLLKFPARGGPEGPDRNFAVWTEKGGVDLTERTLNGLGFEIKRVNAKILDGKKTLHSLVTLSAIKTVDEKEVFDPTPYPEEAVSARVASFDGYFMDDRVFKSSADQHDPRQADAKAGAQAVFLNDANGGMRDSTDVARAITEAKDTAQIFIHKMHAPFDDFSRASDAEPSTLRKTLRELGFGKTLLIVSANDLRLAGIRLRGHLSWDAVLTDLASALGDPAGFLAQLCGEYAHVLIQFGVEAVALLDQNGGNLHFVFHPSSAEGDLALERPGSLYGQMNAYACALLAALSENEWRLETEPMLRALAAARVYAAGAISVPAYVDYGKGLTWPKVSITESADTTVQVTDPGDRDQIHRRKEREALSHIMRSIADIGSEDDFRLILHLNGETIVDLATRIVKGGESELKMLPSARIGKFVTIDRTEMESYRTIQRLIDHYLADESASKPISIGVFGPPGAGKSFGIKEFVKRREIPFFEFNMSEAAEEALPGYFHQIRDVRLRGKVPLCFFDEFDSRGRTLVARFLAPMQDGEFRDGTRTHPIGRAIFVFAGGTARTAGEFGEVVDAEAAPEKSGNAKELKIPDFISRLSATLDVLGPNPVDDNDRLGYLLRRAVLLRNLIEKTLPQVVADGRGTADIDDEVIEAFLSGTNFVFGARSIEQVLKMCAVSPSQSRLGVSDVPDVQRLRLHLESPEDFLLKISTRVERTPF